MSLAERARTRSAPAGIWAGRRRYMQRESQIGQRGLGYRCAKLEEERLAAPADSKDLFKDASSLPNSEDIQVNLGRVLYHQWANIAHHAQVKSILRIQIKSNPEKPTLTPDVEKFRRSIDELFQALGVPAEKIQARASDPEIVSLLRKALESIEPLKMTAVEPATVLEEFDGYVDSIDGDTAYVTLESRLNGDVLYGEYSARELLVKGIREQTRFLCETVKGGGAGRVRFAPLPKNKVTDEEARAIANEMREAFSGDNDSVITY